MFDLLFIKKNVLSLQKKQSMPEICRFFGIDKGLVKGYMPRSVLKKVFEWMDLHRDELMKNWNILQEGKEPFGISPLK